MARNPFQLDLEETRSKDAEACNNLLNNGRKTTPALQGVEESLAVNNNPEAASDPQHKSSSNDQQQRVELGLVRRLIFPGTPEATALRPSMAIPPAATSAKLEPSVATSRGSSRAVHAACSSPAKV